MLRSPPALGRRALVTILLVACAAECRAIEMFTFFGDGSRIGLPSLEVPIEAYPGIPLRSDRIRARRAARRQPMAAPATPAQAGLPRGITIREMPVPRKPQARPTAARKQAAPVAPAPEDVLPGLVETPLAD